MFPSYVLGMYGSASWSIDKTTSPPSTTTLSMDGGVKPQPRGCKAGNLGCFHHTHSLFEFRRVFSRFDVKKIQLPYPSSFPFHFASFISDLRACAMWHVRAHVACDVLRELALLHLCDRPWTLII